MEKMKRCMIMKQKDKIKALELVMKTNEFVLVLSKRYGIENSKLAVQHRVKFKIDGKKYRTFLFDMLLLANIGIRTGYSKLIRNAAETDMQCIGKIREYLFCSIENTDRCEFLMKNNLQSKVFHMNHQYKEYIKYITENNLLKDFVTEKYVKDSFKEFSQNFNTHNISVFNWMTEEINGT